MRAVFGVVLFVLWASSAAAGGGLEEVWRADLGSDRYGSVEIVGNKLHATNTKGQVHRLDLKTGEIEWSVSVVPPRDRIQNGLAASSDGLWVATGVGIVGVAPRTGKVRWKADLGGAISNVPAVDGRQVLAGTMNGKVALLAAGSGKVVWSRKLGWSTTSVALVGEYAFVNTQGNKEAGLYCLSRATGETRWKYPATGKSAAFARGVVIFGDAALRITDGEPLWLLDAPARFWAVGRGVVVGIFGKTRIAGFDPKTGKELWRHEVPEDSHYPLRSGPVVTGGKVYVTVERGEILALDAKSGGVIDRTVIAGLKSIHASVAISRGMLIAAGSNGTTVGLKLPDARASWRGLGGGARRFGQTFERSGKSILATEVSLEDSPLDRTSGKKEFTAAKVIEELNARIDALADVIRQWPEGVAARSARVILREAYRSRLIGEEFWTLPKGQWGISTPGLDEEIQAFIDAPPRTVDIEGLKDLGRPDLVEAATSRFFGRRCWACSRIGELKTAAARDVLVRVAASEDHIFVRARAVGAFRRWPEDPALRDPLLRALSDSAAHIRRAAVIAAPVVLGQAEGERLLAKVAARDTDANVKKKAVEVIRESRGEPGGR
jgi:outer membrane protein assembly factor BamB